MFFKLFCCLDVGINIQKSLGPKFFANFVNYDLYCFFQRFTALQRTYTANKVYNTCSICMLNQISQICFTQYPLFPLQTKA